MVRINLLPAEIVERRKWERYYPYVFVAGAVLLGVVLVTWLATQILVAQRVEALQGVEETEAALNKQAAALAIFEQQQQQLQAREQVVKQALFGRMDIGRVMEEISLVLPDSVWASELELSQVDGMKLTASTQDVEDPVLSEGYKSVAAALVRLGSLDSLYDVWLGAAEASDYQDFQGANADGEAKIVGFTCEGKINAPLAVPAPPTKAGK